MYQDLDGNSCVAIFGDICIQVFIKVGSLGTAS